MYVYVGVYKYNTGLLFFFFFGGGGGGGSDYHMCT